jgi:hypothetical protein
LLDELGISPGPDLLKRVMARVDSGHITYITIGAWFELRWGNMTFANHLFLFRSLIIQGQGKFPEGAITSGDFCSITFYVVRKETLEGRDNTKMKNYKKFLQDNRKFVKLKKEVEAGTWLLDDRWMDAENYLMKGVERKNTEPRSTSHSSTSASTIMLQESDYHLGGEGRSGLGSAQGEQGKVPDNLEVDSDDEAGLDAAVVGGEDVVGGDHGLNHPLDRLMSKLKKFKKEGTACLECGATVRHYCQSCLLAGYCSAPCQLLHWQGDHSEDCATWAARLHGGAGLVPPPPDESPALRAARKARARARDMTHSTVLMHRDTLEKLEETEKEVAERREENARLAREK